MTDLGFEVRGLPESVLPGAGDRNFFSALFVPSG